MAYADIQKRIKRRKIRFRFFLFLIIISISVILLFKMPIFIVKNISTGGNNIVESEMLIELSGIEIGQNLLKLNMRQIKQNIFSNPYIEKCKITRNLFGNVYINVTERQSVGVAKFESKYVTFDKKGVIIEVLDTTEGINLPLIDGMDISGAEPGKTMELADTRKLSALEAIFNNISKCGLSGIINEIDINSLLSIVLKNGQGVNIKIGTIENIDKKLMVSKAIMDEDVVKNGLKGTIDVSFNGNPVFRQE